MDEHSNWVLGGIASVVGTLAAAVTALWKLNESRNAKAIESLTMRADKCEQERTELRVRVAKLEATVCNDDSHKDK